MEEVFETYDAAGLPLGLESRSFIHRHGIWHRASNVFLFDGNHRLLIQQRQMTKDVCPGLWDLSAAEHLDIEEAEDDGEPFEENKYSDFNVSFTAVGDTSLAAGQRLFTIVKER